MENIYNLVNQTLAGGIHRVAPPLSRSVRQSGLVDANLEGAPSLSSPILARQVGEVDLASESESPKVAPSLSRSVRQGGSRDSGSLDSNLDHTRLQWSRWFRCESSFSVLLVPAKAGIFALGEEMVPAGDGSKRMLALFEISATDDLGMTLGRLFLPGNPLLAKLNAGRCFARYTVIEDAAERSAAYNAFRRWMQDSAETASGIGGADKPCGSEQPCGAGALAREAAQQEPCGSDIPVRAQSGVETDLSNSMKVVKDNSPSTSSAWGVGFTEAPNREATEVVRRPRPLPSGF